MTEEEARRGIVRCPCCSEKSDGTFPVGIDHPVRYGPRLSGFATYLHSVHLLPFARCAQILQGITLAPFYVGRLSQALAMAFTGLESFDARLDQTLAQVGHKHADETGSRIAGKLQWVHVRCTNTLCRLFRHNIPPSKVPFGDNVFRGGTCSQNDF